MAATAAGAPQRLEQGFLDSHPEMQEGRPAARGQEPIICPACGGANRHDAVFCGNLPCHKALGDFKYVLEELQAEAQWHHRLADKVAAFITTPHFVAAHFLWFALWVTLNTGVIAFVQKFDNYPFFLLVTILAVETIFITIFVLISNTRQSTHADKRAELDYEVNVRTYRGIDEIRAMVGAILERMDRVEATGREGVHGKPIDEGER